TVWLALVSTVTVLLVTRPALDALILRQPGTLYAVAAAGDVANFYTVQVFNRTRRSTTFSIEVVEPRGATVTALGPLGRIDPDAIVESRVLVRAPHDALAGASTPVRFVVRSEGRIVQEV